MNLLISFDQMYFTHKLTLKMAAIHTSETQLSETI